MLGSALLLLLSTFAVHVQSYCYKISYYGQTFRALPEEVSRDTERCRGGAVFVRPEDPKQLRYCMKVKPESKQRVNCMDECTCGKVESATDSKITLTKPLKGYWNKYPWLVKVHKKNKLNLNESLLTCSGTILNNNAILTSAACCDLGNGEVVGADIWNDAEKEQSDTNIKFEQMQRKINPDYRTKMHPADASKSTIEMSDEAMGYNLCILTSTHHFGWTGLSPICLPSSEEDNTSHGIAKGWQHGGFFSDFALKTKIMESTIPQEDRLSRAKFTKLIRTLTHKEIMKKDDIDDISGKEDKEVCEKGLTNLESTMKKFIRALNDDWMFNDITADVDDIAKEFKANVLKGFSDDSDAKKQFEDKYQDKLIITDAQLKIHNALPELAARILNINELFYAFPTERQVPKEGKVKILSAERCEELFDKSNIEYQSNFLCAQKYDIDEKSVSSSECSGDQGGPLVIKKGGSYVLYGISSFYINQLRTDFPACMCDCQNPRTAAVYVDIRKDGLLRWIKDTIKFDENECPHDMNGSAETTSSEESGSAETETDKTS